jgi:hypothetical protein
MHIFRISGAVSLRITHFRNLFTLFSYYQQNLEQNNESISLYKKNNGDFSRLLLNVTNYTKIFRPVPDYGDLKFHLL